MSTTVSSSAVPSGPTFVSVKLIEEQAREMAAQMRLSGRVEQADAVLDTLARGGAVRVEMTVDQAVEMATVLHRTGRHDAAEDVYRKALKAARDHARGRHFFGLLLHQTKRSDDGVRQMRKSLEALQDAPWAWNNLGNVEKERGDRDAAEAAYRKALSLDPNFAEAHSNLGVVLREERNWEEADASYARAIELRANYSEAWFNRGKLMLARGRIPEAIEMLSRAIVLGVTVERGGRDMLARAHVAIGEVDKAAAIYREWAEAEPDNPRPRHYLAACLAQETPIRAGDDYVAATFNDFAESFEEKLAMLKYRAPEVVAAALAAALPADATLDAICDAGCGTGLCGPFLRPRARRLVGVDLSAGMLAKAKPRGQYDELVEAELTAFLKSRRNAFDAIVSADTLCYFGALEEFAAAAHDSLRRNGLLVFTIEALLAPDAPNYRLHPHGRYAHRGDYVENVLAAAGFRTEPLRRDVLRNESGRPVEGFIIVARRD